VFRRTGTDSAFRDKLNRVFALAEVESVVDGMRHSAVSYYLARHGETGIRQVARWTGNSVAMIEKRSLRYFRPEEGQVS
jgi:hypothetical protein